VHRGSSLLGLDNVTSERVWRVREVARRERDSADQTSPSLRPTSALADADSDTHLELDFRSQALQLGQWLGWISIIAVLGGLALDAGSKHRWLLLALTLTAASANAAAMFVPWREWLQIRRGQVLVDLWSGGLIGFVAVLVFTGGANFALLLFLAIPFVAVVQVGWRRGFWLAVSGGTCALAAAVVPLPAGPTAMRLALVAAAVAVVLLLARTIRREASAHTRAAARADLARTLATEANHRIKNNLQTAADLLLLGRPQGGDGRPFDDTAARIQSIAIVHRLLTETEDSVDASALLNGIARGAPVPVAVEAQPTAFDASTAQKVGIVANELVTNAFQHGAPPITLTLDAGEQHRLLVDDCGNSPEGATGLGLQLVQRMVEQGLSGRFTLGARPGGGTRAEVVFPAEPERKP
jgi:two-component sensor histidine kinase